MAENDAGNVVAMREALVQCELFLGYVDRHAHPTLNPGDKCVACEGVEELRNMVCRALATPARNCDVGTAQEQAERFNKFCESHPYKDGVGSRCFNCELDSCNCEIAWAQMPYNGGDK